ncbi:hypothetical protein K443DRAFT_683914 [Laccaria amethystina LaAM-08-1]|uniref:Uncharacterized protein n=1 Tax=Laccaria amethystina LaAM-08-1 TaxID=1095629 RepID=A0A0C9X991_9AGAR|nr:hypothetical protein K443DRAFT_683914 [Laccaria amethystina LaAM-08-1]
MSISGGSVFGGHVVMYLAPKTCIKNVRSSEMVGTFLTQEQKVLRPSRSRRGLRWSRLHPGNFYAEVLTAR